MTGLFRPGPDRRKVFVRIAGELRRDIAAGRFPVGEPSPSIGELTDRFGSAKATVERALDVLRGEGLLTSRQGSRTEFQILFGQLQVMRSHITDLRSKIEELDERTKDL